MKSKTINADEVKARVSLMELINIMGKGNDIVKVNSNNYEMNPCPACGHKNSFRWKINRNTPELFKCFSGDCGVAGDIWTLLNILKPEYSFPDAVAFVAKQAGLASGIATSSNKLSTNPSKKNTKRSIVEHSVDFYQKNTKHADFETWRKKRKYNHNILSSFKIGFSDGMGGLHRFLQEKNYTEAQILESGLVRKDKSKGHLYDLFYKKAIIFPYQDKGGESHHIKAKPIDSAGNHSGSPFQLKTTQKTPLFFGMQNSQNQPAKNNHPIYIVEGETDVLAMAHMDIYAWGLGKLLSNNQREYIGSLIKSGYSIVSAFDNDNAGRSYHDQLNRFASMPRIITDKIDDVYGDLLIAKFPDNYKDPDETWRAGYVEWVGQTKPVYTDLRTCLSAYRSTINDNNKWSADVVARVLFDWFDSGGTWYVRQDEIFLTYEGKAYTVDTKLPFKSLLFRLAGINYANKSSKATWEALSAIAYSEAKHVDGASWLHNQHDPPSTSWHIGNNNIATMQDGRVTVGIAGSGDVMLIPSPKMLPIELQPQKINDTKNNEWLLRLFDFAELSFACSQPWQLYLCALFIKTLFLGWSRAQGIHNFTGSMGSGKSDAANLLTVLTYGQTFVTAGSTASNYTDATQNPWTVLDNLESRNVGNDVRDFLLHVGTGIVRQKRKAGTDSENVYERAQTQVITTSIEQTETPELIERTFIIPFGHQWFSANHPGSAILEELVIKDRNYIISAIMQLTADLLPTFANKRAENLKWIQKHYPKHSKKRLNEHLATIATITDAMLEASPDHNFRLDSAHGALDYWITEQDAMTAELTADSNPIIRYLDLLETEWRNQSTIMKFTEETGRIIAEITLAGLLAEFDMIAKHYQIKDRYKSVRHLSVRIVNEADALQRAGWTISKKCVVRGRPVYSISREY